MSKLVALSRQTHSGLCWRRPSNFRFAASDHLMPLGLREMQQAVLALPTGFIHLQDRWLLIAIQGLRNGENLVVNESGDWLAAHLPNVYQGFPFHMARVDQEHYQVCVRQEFEFVRAADEVPAEATEWRRFFDDDGEREELLAGLMEKMQQHTNDLVAAERATARLAELELLKDWEITFGNEDAPMRVRGLCNIDHQRLAELDGEALAGLRDSGALYLAYTQPLSGHHLPLLVEIARQRWQQPEERELDFGETDNSGNISFDNL